MESECPRSTATSCGLSRRGGSGRRALSPISAGRSEANVTSRSGFCATARMQPAIERFSGSAGASFLSLGLRFEIDILVSRRPRAGRRLLSTQCHVDRALRQLLAEAALVELRHERALELVALVQEGEPEREAEIAEDLGVLRPGDHRAGAHHGR